MDAIITGESERIGLSVIDNNDVEHLIEIDENGEIKYHEQDGYPDTGANRTNEESEHIKQARRYAKYYVSRERGHQTIEPREHPEWLAVVASVISQLSTDDFEAQFGDYYQQLRSHVETDVSRVIEIPDGDIAGLISYRQNIHLNIELETVLGESEAQSLADSLSENTDVEAMVSELYAALEDVVISPDALTVEGVSDIGALYQGRREDVVIEPADQYPTPADARLELSPTKIDDGGYLPLEGFQLLVVHHLLCQARDYYLGMGLEPPESLRVLGLGTYRQTVRNEHLSMYKPVHATTSPVDGYRLPGIGTHLEQ